MLSLFDYILERQSVTFDSANANYGQCIILGGGAGSGKGFIQSKILADFKKIDVDEFKEMYLKLIESGKIKDDTKYDLSNPEDVSKLHDKVKAHGWKKTQRRAFVKARNAETTGDRLPNVLWDMVCGELDDITEIIEMAKPMGYTITLVWVVCNKETAKIANQIRKRHVSDDIIEKTHNGAYETLSALFDGKYPDIEQFIDKMWIGFSAGYGRKLEKEFAESPVLKVKGSKNPKLFFDKPLIDKFLKEPCPYDFAALAKKVNSGKKDNQIMKFMELTGLTEEEIMANAQANEAVEFNYEEWNKILS